MRVGQVKSSWPRKGQWWWCRDHQAADRYRLRLGFVDRCRRHRRRRPRCVVVVVTMSRGRWPVRCSMVGGGRTGAGGRECIFGDGTRGTRVYCGVGRKVGRLACIDLFSVVVDGAPFEGFQLESRQISRLAFYGGRAEKTILLFTIQHRPVAVFKGWTIGAIGPLGGVFVLKYLKNIAISRDWWAKKKSHQLPNRPSKIGQDLP